MLLRLAPRPENPIPQGSTLVFSTRLWFILSESPAICNAAPSQEGQLYFEENSVSALSNATHGYT